MKIRLGFVSNSSSSSFIVNFPEFPNSKDNLSDMMGDCGTSFLSTDEVLKIVWEDIEKGSLNNEVINSLEKNGIDIYDNWEVLYHFLGENFTDKIADSKYDDSNLSFEDVRKIINDRLDSLEKNENKNTFVFEYSDDDIVGSSLENGDIFRNVDYERIYKH